MLRLRKLQFPPSMLFISRLVLSKDKKLHIKQAKTVQCTPAD